MATIEYEYVIERSTIVDGVEQWNLFASTDDREQAERYADEVRGRITFNDQVIYVPR